jgi:hypothetical protein
VKENVEKKLNYMVGKGSMLYTTYYKSPNHFESRDNKRIKLGINGHLKRHEGNFV